MLDFGTEVDWQIARMLDVETKMSDRNSERWVTERPDNDDVGVFIDDIAVRLNWNGCVRGVTVVT